MATICGSDSEDWREIGDSWIVNGDELPPLFNLDGVNQESDPSNVPSEQDDKIVESLPVNVPAIATLDRRPSEPNCDLLRPMGHDFASFPQAFRRRSVATSRIRFRPGAPAPDVVVAKKRFRSPDWNPEAKQAYLELKVEALRAAVEGKPDWDFISQGLRERHKIDRSSKVCENLWGTLRKDFRAIRRHESSKSGPQTSNWVSYWEMDEDDRSRKKLPRLFSLEWCKLIERILAAQENRSGKKSRGIPVQESLGDEDYQYPYLHPGIPVQVSLGDEDDEDEDEDEDLFSYLLHPADPSRDGSKKQTPGERPRMTDRAETPNSKYAGRMGSGAIIFEEDPLVKQQVEEAVSSALNCLGYRKRSGASTQEDDLTTMLPTLVKQQVEDAVNSTLQPLAWTKRFYASIDADDLMLDAQSRWMTVAPSIKQMIEDAFDSALEPVSFALQVREQEKQEYQEQLRALEEKKQALKREEMQIKRQRPGRLKRTLRTSYKQQGLRGKNPVAEGVIPA